MTEKNKISDISRWIALACLVVPMFASYFFDDMFSSVSQLFRNPELLELGWILPIMASTQEDILSYAYGEA